MDLGERVQSLILVLVRGVQLLLLCGARITVIPDLVERATLLA